MSDLNPSEETAISHEWRARLVAYRDACGDKSPAEIARILDAHENLVTLCHKAHGTPPSYGALKRGQITRIEYDAAKKERSDARDAIRVLLDLAE